MQKQQTTTINVVVKLIIWKIIKTTDRPCFSLNSSVFKNIHMGHRIPCIVYFTVNNHASAAQEQWHHYIPASPAYQYLKCYGYWDCMKMSMQTIRNISLSSLIITMQICHSFFTNLFMSSNTTRMTLAVTWLPYRRTTCQWKIIACIWSRIRWLFTLQVYVLSLQLLNLARCKNAADYLQLILCLACPQLPTFILFCLFLQHLCWNKTTENYCWQ